MAGSCCVYQITAVIIKVNISKQMIIAFITMVQKKSNHLVWKNRNGDLSSTGGAMRRTHTPTVSILKGRLQHMTNSIQHMITTITIIIPKIQNTALFFQKNRTLFYSFYIICFIIHFNKHIRNLWVNSYTFQMFIVPRYVCDCWLKTILWQTLYTVSQIISQWHKAFLHKKSDSLSPSTSPIKKIC